MSGGIWYLVLAHLISDLALPFTMAPAMGSVHKEVYP